MLFCTTSFLWFFLVVFSAYWVTPWARARVLILLAASFYFYASWNKWLALIIFASSLADFGIGLALETVTARGRRRALLGLSVVANLGLLCYFKYANFFLQSLEEAVRAAGGTAAMPVLSVVLPVGISFYTFEAISYSVDVYQRRIPAERNPFHFLLFITFFPHLVAGPIVRARDFLPQIRKRKRWNWARANAGVQLFLLGMFKKMVIADRMALYADPVFAAPDQYGSGAAWLAMVAYALQIYCDFSGYSDMALGAAHLLGYRLAVNFDLPYLSANVSEFWRRWHISLSTWLRDYVFIPLGGSRNSPDPRRNEWLTARNLVVTMALGGLWHGAAWTFVVWGVMHGLFLVAHRRFRVFCEARPTLDAALQTPPGVVLRVATTFLCVSTAWVFFRAQTFAAAAAFVKRLFAWKIGAPAELTYHCLATLGAVVLVAHVMTYHGFWRRLADRLPAPVLGAAYAVLATATLALTPETAQVFIYFQF
jgi:alginate O-acetyltransferase complex protein AlgI